MEFLWVTAEKKNIPEGRIGFSIWVVTRQTGGDREKSRDDDERNRSLSPIIGISGILRSKVPYDRKAFSRLPT